MNALHRPPQWNHGIEFKEAAYAVAWMAYMADVADQRPLPSDYGVGTDRARTIRERAEELAHRASVDALRRIERRDALVRR